MIVAELLYFHSKQTINSKIKESEEKRQLLLNNDVPKLMIEKITLKRDLRSSMFDNLLDEINCPKTFNGIIKKLELKEIKNWQSDLEKIYTDLGHNPKYANEMIEDLEQYDNFKFYELKIINKAITKENIKRLYDDNDIYRIIYYENEMYLIIFQNKNEI